MQFVKEFNARTADQDGNDYSRCDHSLRGPLVFFHHEDTTRGGALLLKAAGVAKVAQVNPIGGRSVRSRGSDRGNRNDQDARPEYDDLEAASRTVAGTARSMGLIVVLN